MIQVADRFHANLREAPVRLLDRHHAQISAAARAVAEGARGLEQPTPSREDVQMGPAVGKGSEIVEIPANNENARAEGDRPAPAVTPEPATLSKGARLSMERRAQRLEKYHKVIALQESSMSLRAIARRLGMGRDLVTKFLRAGSFPERAKTRRPRTIDRVNDELRGLWDSGTHIATELHRRLRRSEPLRQWIERAGHGGVAMESGRR